jgi:hypothetical protein
MLDQRGDPVAALEEGMPLEAAEADVAVRQPHHDGGPGRAGLIAALQALAGLDQREGPRGRHAKRFQQGGRQHLAHAALQGQPAVA